MKNLTIKQLSVFLENRPGALMEITSFLADNDIDIRALSVADAKDFGIVRIIVVDAEATKKLLLDNGFVVTDTDVLAVVMEDKPGGLVKILRVLTQAEVNIEYSYAFTSRVANHAYTIFRVADNEKAASVLSEAGIELCSQDMLHG